MGSSHSRSTIVLAFVCGCAIAWGQMVPRDLRMAAAATYVGACERCTSVSSTTCPIPTGGNRAECGASYDVATGSGDRYVHLGNSACEDPDCTNTYDEKCKTYPP